MAALIGIAIACMPAIATGGCESSLNGLVGDVTGAVVVATASDDLIR